MRHGSSSKSTLFCATDWLTRTHTRRFRNGSEPGVAPDIFSGLGRDADRRFDARLEVFERVGLCRSRPLMASGRLYVFTGRPDGLGRARLGGTVKDGGPRQTGWGGA
jgi:hypothetical protein